MKQHIHIGIVGFGAAGVSAFLQFIKIVQENPKLDPRKITISAIEKSGEMGPGLPYSTPEKCHILNLPARVMSPIPGKPDDFVIWLKENPSLWKKQYPKFKPEEDDFPPRSLYGIYLKHLAETTKQQAEKMGMAVNFIHDEVVNITPMQDAKYTVTLRSKPALEVNQAILCIGHLPSSLYTELKGKKNYFHSPWPTSKLRVIPDGKTVYVLGTRLTAIDIANILAKYGENIKIVLVSRGGLLPCVIGNTKEYARLHLTIQKILAETLNGLKEYIRLKRIQELFWQELETAENKKFDEKARQAFLNPTKTPKEWLKAEIAAAKSPSPRHWQSFLFSLYSIVPYIWQVLSTEDKETFLKDYFSIFMTYLAAFPLKNAEKILAMLESGQLEVKGGLTSVKHDERTNNFILTFKDGTRIPAKYLINATGPGYSIATTDNLLLENMRKNGLIQSDPFGGIKVHPKTFQILDADGKPLPGLSATGELVRGTFLATTDLGQTVAHIQGVTHMVGEALKKAAKAKNNNSSENVTCISPKNGGKLSFWHEPRSSSEPAAKKTRIKSPRKEQQSGNVITLFEQPVQGTEKTPRENKGKEVLKRQSFGMQ